MIGYSIGININHKDPLDFDHPNNHNWNNELYKDICNGILGGILGGALCYSTLSFIDNYDI